MCVCDNRTIGKIIETILILYYFQNINWQYFSSDPMENIFKMMLGKYFQNVYYKYFRSYI